VYFNQLRVASSTPDEYERKKKHLAEIVGMSVGGLYALAAAKRSYLIVENALRLELATNGQVPWECLVKNPDKFKETMERVALLRQFNGTP
jgi:hypothetical protein